MDEVTKTINLLNKNFIAINDLFEESFEEIEHSQRTADKAVKGSKAAWKLAFWGTAGSLYLGWKVWEEVKKLRDRVDLICGKIEDSEDSGK